MGSAKASDVFDHGVPVLRTTRKAGQHEERGIGELPQFGVRLGRYYVARTSHDVVVSQLAAGCKLNWEVGDCSELFHIKSGPSRLMSFPRPPT